MGGRPRKRCQALECKGVAEKLRLAKLEVQEVGSQLRVLQEGFAREVNGAVRARLCDVNDLTRELELKTKGLKAAVCNSKYWRSAALSLQQEVRELTESQAALSTQVAAHEHAAATAAATALIAASRHEREERARHLDVKRNAAQQSDEYLASERKVAKLEQEVKRLRVAATDAQRLATQAQSMCEELREDAIRESGAAAQALEARDEAAQAQELAERREEYAKQKAGKLKERVDELSAPTRDRTPEEWRALKDVA